MIEEAADGYAFLAKELEVNMPNDFGNAVEPPQTKNYVEATEQLVTEIFVRDLAKSLAFFQQLGFELLRQQGGFAELTWEGHKLFLDQRANLPPVPDFPAANVRVMVPDVDAAWKSCNDSKAKVIRRSATATTACATPQSPTPTATASASPAYWAVARSRRRNCTTEAARKVECLKSNVERNPNDECRSGPDRCRLLRVAPFVICILGI